MALTASTMLPLGTKAPDFQLPDVVSGQIISLSTFSGKKALLVMFICQHCPFVKHIKNELARLGKDYADKELGIVAISANDVKNYPDDSPENLKQMALSLDFKFSLCYDETQNTAKAYTAACTPDFFLFDEGRKLVYRGQLDDSRPSNNEPVTGKDLRAAIESILAGKPVDSEQKPSIGCNIKWKPGNHLKKPTLILYAADDPMFDPTIVPDLQAACAGNPAINLMLTAYGGHVGYISSKTGQRQVQDGDRWWAWNRVLDWCDRQRAGL